MIALGLIYDVASQRLKDLPMPHVPKPPLYDGRLGKSRDGFVWMSEMLLRDLEFWEARKRASGESGSQYAERDAKTATTMAKWIEWRRLFPTEAWSGKRGDERATADPPNANPKINKWPERTEKPASGAQGKGRPAPANDEDDGYGF
jgi:hypothetical protein